MCDQYENGGGPGSSDTRTLTPTESTAPAPASGDSEPNPSPGTEPVSLGCGPTPAYTAEDGTSLSLEELARSMGCRLPVASWDEDVLSLSYRTEDGRHLEVDIWHDGYLTWFYRDTPNDVTLEGTRHA